LNTFDVDNLPLSRAQGQRGFRRDSFGTICTLVRAFLSDCATRGWVSDNLVMRSDGLAMTSEGDHFSIRFHAIPRNVCQQIANSLGFIRMTHVTINAYPLRKSVAASPKSTLSEKWTTLCELLAYLPTCSQVTLVGGEGSWLLDSLKDVHLLPGIRTVSVLHRVNDWNVYHYWLALWLVQRKMNDRSIGKLIIKTSAHPSNDKLQIYAKFVKEEVVMGP
jgi:hypothetical protein